MRNKRGIIRGVTNKVWLICLLLLFLLILLGLSFPNYLFQLQNKERLLKVKDYTEYKIEVVKQVRPEVKMRFRYNDVDYYYDGLEDIFILYGSTKTTLQNVLEQQFLSYEEFMVKALKEEEDDDKIVYQYKERPNKECLFNVVESKRENKVIMKVCDKQVEDGEEVEEQQQ